MTSNPWFINYKKNPLRKVTLFCFHHSGGAASTFFPWIENLSPSLEMIAIQLPGRENRFCEKPTCNLDEILECLSEGFNAFKETPFLLFGHSLGGLLAYEFSKKIFERYSLSPQHLIVSAAKAPHRLRKHRLHTLNNQELTETLQMFGGIDDILLQHEESLALFMPIIRSDFAISEHYKGSQTILIDCGITHLSGRSDQTLNRQDILEWGKYTTRGFESLTFEGDHFFIKNNQDTIIKHINIIAESCIS